nr:MAG TPA: hypothetical protein [Caudoviricetes sp.]
MYCKGRGAGAYRGCIYGLFCIIMQKRMGSVGWIVYFCI